MKPLMYVAMGVLLALAALAILFWVLASGRGDGVVQQAPAPDRYLQADFPVGVDAAPNP